MSLPGKYLKKHFKGRKIEIYTGDNAEWLHYDQSDSMSQMLIVGTVLTYDEECGVLVLQSETGHVMYVVEDSISMFWECGQKFDLLKTTASTIRTGKKHDKKRDIM